MARRKTQAAGNLADYVEGDANEEQLARLSAARAADVAKEGHNSGQPPDEVLTRNTDAIELGLRNILLAQKGVQQARAEFKAIRDTAKTDCGSKGWVDSMVKKTKLKLESAKGGTHEIVTEHRQIGILLKLDPDCPLGHQYGLFAEPAPTAPDEQQQSEAQLAGAHAYGQGGKLDENPHLQGTPKYVGWSKGWLQAQSATARSMGPSH